MAENRKPVIGGFYRHFKERLYQVLHVAVHADTGEELVVYQALYGDFKVYVRPLADFVSEVDRKKYPDVKQKFRFEQVTLSKEGSARSEETNPLAAVEAEPEEEESLDDVNPLLMEYLDAETYEARLKIFTDMEDIMDMHMLYAIAASLDISLNGDVTLEEGCSIIRYNLVTQMRYECSRWR